MLQCVPPTSPLRLSMSYPHYHIASCHVGQVTLLSDKQILQMASLKASAG